MHSVVVALDVRNCSSRYSYYITVTVRDFFQTEFKEQYDNAVKEVSNSTQVYNDIYASVCRYSCTVIGHSKAQKYDPSSPYRPSNTMLQCGKVNPLIHLTIFLRLA